MTVNNDLVRKFASMLNIQQEKPPTVVYGNIIIDNTNIMVQIDGNDTPIPIVNDKKYLNGDRVKVTIQNNRFTVDPIQ